MKMKHQEPFLLQNCDSIPLPESINQSVDFSYLLDEIDAFVSLIFDDVVQLGEVP